MENIIGIRREDLSKKGEKRVALVPELIQTLTRQGISVVVQPAIHPETREVKRTFSDQAYEEAGALVSEDLSAATIIFGLKEIDPALILPNKTYLFFSHTHKGQLKNRRMLQTLIDRKCSLIDFELVMNENKLRTITAFTYFAGYAGMIDSLWTLGKRLSIEGIKNSFEAIPQAIEKEDLGIIKRIVANVGQKIREEGTPAIIPPIIFCFLGSGKTSTGAQEIFDILPVESLSIDQLPEIYAKGSRHKVYKLVLDVPDMFRMIAHSPFSDKDLSPEEFFQLYLQEPQYFESNLEKVFPYVTGMMNCIIWSPRFPRLITRENAAKWYKLHQCLKVIGDISCDPEGAIHFSHETWIDDPVFIYHPLTGKSTPGFEGEGIAVMAVTNLPCEFSADASHQFSEDIHPLIWEIVSANYDASYPEESGLPTSVSNAVILWKGKFTEEYLYMEKYLN
ncbi:MAG: hypothetical protein SF052_18840 [Bacteroidia bacterium]|nr:hypothetical protein [Bacteroidia bacterium]